MELEDIAKRIVEIEEISHDDEVAHSKEDNLREEFIEFVAKTGNKKLSKMATEILKTNNLDFARWCA